MQLGSNELLLVAFMPGSCRRLLGSSPVLAQADRIRASFSPGSLPHPPTPLHEFYNRFHSGPGRAHWLPAGQMGESAAAPPPATPGGGGEPANCRPRPHSQPEKKWPMHEQCIRYTRASFVGANVSMQMYIFVQMGGMAGMFMNP